MTTDADRVKPLEWVLRNDRCPSTAETPFGTYSATKDGRWWLGIELWHHAFTLDRVGTLEAAQAACQADYTSRILSALAPAPQAADAKPVARQWRALEDGFARISWELLGRGEEAGWRELAARLPQKYQIEERDLYAAPLSPAPEGWVLVPRRPTMEMMKAAHAHHEGEAYLPFSLYQAMIDAAHLPSSPVPVSECASEGCGKPATVRFERGGVGSTYCRSCYMRIQALPAAAQEGNGNG